MKRIPVLTLAFAAVTTACVLAESFFVNTTAANAAGSQSALAFSLKDEGPLPDLGGAIAWLNSAPLTGKSLRGKVVLV